MKDDAPAEITARRLLQAYAAGVFPMADSATADEVFWVDPRLRGILPLDGFHVSRSLRRTILKTGFRVSVDRDFAGVVDGCADRDVTWINTQIRALYLELFAMGHAHSVEVWDGPLLVGGLYGVVLGGAFFGESMFSRRRDASKIAMVHTMARLRAGGFTLFDTQFITPHLASLGGVEISRAEYHKRLDRALGVKHADFLSLQADAAPQLVVQLSTQTS